jgi:Icc-related predicted phosphoesterase
VAQERSKRKYRRVFFSTDLHASEIVFRKFISAASFYSVDALVMGGDVTGKTIIPLVKGVDGSYHFNFQGQEFQHVAEKGLPDFETRISNAGLYPHRVSENEYESLRSDPAKISAISDALMTERLARWAILAEENLTPLDVKCYWTGGNDDHQKILDSVKSSEHFVNAEERVIRLDGDHEMVSLGWSNATPWKTPRECDEKILAEKLWKVMKEVVEPSSCVLNVHPPPYDCGLDIAPKLDTNFDPPRPIVSGGQQVLIPVGSTAVREVIEKTKPLLTLCGHIHETKNSSKIGRTMCINPGSEYASGILRGVIVNLVKDKILSFQLTSG